MTELLPGVYDAPAVLRHMHQNADWPDGAVINLYMTLRRLEQQGFVFAVMDPEGFIPTDDPEDDEPVGFEETEDDLHPYYCENPECPKAGHCRGECARNWDICSRCEVPYSDPNHQDLHKYNPNN